MRRESEIAAAREDAARKAAMYNGIYASFQTVHSSGTGLLNYYFESETRLDYDRDYEKYLEKLTFDPDRDVLDIDSGVFIRFSYPAAFPANINYSFPKNPNGSPGWITEPPQDINGFRAGVGFARRQYRMRDTFVKSCDSAVAAIVSQSSTVMTTSDTVAESRSSSFFYQSSTGRLTHFLVLEIWIDPDNQNVWTLAVAQRTD